jgi:peptidylprolyl isomerase
MRHTLPHALGCLALALAMVTPAAAQPAAPAAPPAAPASPAAKPRTIAQVLAETTPADWQRLDPAYTLYMDLATGRVIIHLAPQFAPRYVRNVQQLVRQSYFDGLAITRVQENYVVQWGDPEGKKPLGNAARTLAAEFERSSRGLPFTPLPDPDTYAPEVGFSEGFPAAVDPHLGRAWLVHCYGMVGAGRDENVDSGAGTELYAVIGQSPRHLDRNVTLVGRVVQGMELLTVLPRGTGELGVYEKPTQRVPIRSVRIAAEVPEAQRTPIEELRTDTSTWTAYVEALRNRHEPWFKVPAGRINVCNIPIPVRTPPEH